MARKHKESSAPKEGPETPPESLEDSLGRLESLVERMESGELSMEESLQAFEEGIRLTRACRASLEQAEQKVRILLEQSEDAEPGDFPTDDEHE